MQLPAGNVNPFLSMASDKISASWADPSQPARTNVNFRSKLTAAMTFCVGLDFLPLKACCMCLGTLANTCVPSMAPMQFYSP